MGLPECPIEAPILAFSLTISKLPRASLIGFKASNPTVWAIRDISSRVFCIVCSAFCAACSKRDRLGVVGTTTRGDRSVDDSITDVSPRASSGVS